MKLRIFFLHSVVGIIAIFCNKVDDQLIRLTFGENLSLLAAPTFCVFLLAVVPQHLQNSLLLLVLVAVLAVANGLSVSNLSILSSRSLPQLGLGFSLLPYPAFL